MIQGQFRPISATGQYDPIPTESTRFDTNRSQVGANKKKKKKLRRDTNVWAIASMAAPHVGPHRTLVRHPPSYIGVSWMSSLFATP